MTASAVLEPEPIEIEPRPCEFCGFTIDHHDIDDGEGPEFFCPIDEIEREIFQDAAELVRRWERADPRDAWRHTGEPPPPEIVRNSDISGKPANTPPPYRTPQATVDAFFYLARTEDTDGILKWLARHPRDAQHLHKLWKRKCSTAAL